MKRPHLGLATALLVLGTAATASAHISLEKGTTHKSRYGEAEQKAGPCGRAGGTRGENVYKYDAGETISVELVEFIAHPGYFRIAFDDDGDDAFEDPQSIDPPYRDCLDDPKDHCGAADFYNNESVLMDQIDEHDATLSRGPKTYNWDVKLPDVACDNCTLQIIQVMQDPYPIHAPFTPGEEDIYYQCIDLELEKTSSTPGTSGEPAGDDGGCTVASRGRQGTGAAAFLALSALGAALLRRGRFVTAAR